MIVKNEVDRIERCLRSVAHYIDCYVIVDTGSTDGTPDKIKELLHPIPGEIHHAPFINFSQARNAALDAARASKLEFDYMLLMDADMELRVDNPDALARHFHSPVLALLQKAGGTSYWNTRLLSRYRDGNYVGATHEYLDAGECVPLEGVWFYDHADGSNRKEKFERDVALLLPEVEADPKNARSWFYLGQSYRDAGRHQEALDAYKKRVDLGGWEEEVFVSQMNVAHSYKELGNEDAFVRNMLDAYNLRPIRVEPLYDLAKHYREKGNNNLAAMFAKRGMEIPKPNDMLFVSDHAHDVGCREEFSIAAFYDDKLRDQGFRVCDSLALDKRAEHYTRDLARANLYHYIRTLDAYMHVTQKKIPFTPPDGYVAMNPSIIRTWGAGYMVNVRCVNYTINEWGQYLIRAGDGTVTNDNPINTRNFLISMTEDRELFRPVELQWSRSPALYPLVTGLEDVRLFTHGPEAIGSVHALANIREMNADGWCEQHLVELWISHDEAQVKGVTHIKPRERHHEKNWMPIEGFFKHAAMYRLGQTIDPTGDIVNHRNDYSSETLSGGGQVLEIHRGPYTGYSIAIVHEARPNPHRNGQRYYNHRFVVFDQQLNVKKISRPFVFQDKQIEFAAGIALNHNYLAEPTEVTISFGVRDCEAWIAVVSLDSIMQFTHA